MAVLKTSEADLRNLGRGGFTGNAEDLYKFRVPQLYNLGDSGPYFHGSSKQTLEEVIEYFNNGVHENPKGSREPDFAFFPPAGPERRGEKRLSRFYPRWVEGSEFAAVRSGANHVRVVFSEQ